jgi:group I intron endonuclease
MNRYEKGKIYKLVNNTDHKVYVGSTCMLLSKRLYNHKAKAKLFPNRKLYSHLNAIGWESVKIVLIEEFKCANKMELEKRERYYVDDLEPELNFMRPRVTEQEHKETVQVYNAKYQRENKATLRLKRKLKNNG